MGVRRYVIGLRGGKLASGPVLIFVPTDVVTSRTWPDYLSMEKARQYGWKEERDTVQSYYEIFDELKRMKIIPK
jgi:hypothetical protein